MSEGGSQDDRRTKLERLRAEGIDPFPARLRRRRADRARPRGARGRARAGRGDRGRLPRGRTPGGPAGPRRRRLPRPGRPLGPHPASRAQGRPRRGVVRPPRLARPRRPDRRRRHGLQVPPGRADAGGDRLDAAGEVAARAAGEVPRARGRGDPLPPARARPDRQRGGPRAVHPARAGGLCRSAAGSTSGASSRSRRRCSSRSTAARSRARSSPTTTRSTATSTCASPPSCTSSA